MKTEEELDEMERHLYTKGSDPIRDDESVAEYLGRMAKVWHKEELKERGR